MIVSVGNVVYRFNYFQTRLWELFFSLLLLETAHVNTG